MRFHGLLPEESVAELLGVADGLFLPTKRDAWGLVINEAMACGVPVVASPWAGATRDLIEHGVTGYVIDPEDTGALAEVMGQLIADEPSCREVGQAGARFIREKASLEKAAEGLVSAVRSARPKVLIIGPVPPPAFGVAKATQLMLESSVLRERFELVHLDTSDVAGFTGIGRLTWGNVTLGIRHVARLIRLLRAERPDVVLLTASQGLMGLVRDGLFVSLSRTYRVRTVTYLRGSRYAELKERQGRIAATVFSSILKHTSRVIVLGESLVAMAQKVCPNCDVAVVPNGCPPAVAEGLVGTRDNDHPLVLYVGRLSRDKGLEDALVAARLVVSALPATKFVFCGEWDSSEYQRAVEPLIQQYGLAGRVAFPGPVSADERAALLGRAWVLIVPSHSEGQPWVILEAMSAGVPVVATATGAIAETVGDGIGGVVVSVADSAGLAQGIIGLLQDDQLWSKTSQAALLRYHERFTVERSHTLLAEQLDQVASR